MHFVFAAVLATALVVPCMAAAAGKHAIHLRLQASTLAEGPNYIHNFKTYGRLIGRAVGKKIQSYELETMTRIILPMKKAGLREELQDPPKGSAEPECVEWKEQCFEQAAVRIKVCQTLCTKVYDAATKTAVAIDNPPNVYVAILSDVIDFDDSALLNTDDQ